MSDEALTAATGRGWATWFELLDAVGATGWKHAQIASWLHEQHGVPRWWCQSVTVGFEQERGMRLPGQRADGTFEVSVSATLPSDADAALTAVIAAVSAKVGNPPTSTSRDAAYPTARWKLDGREVLLARANPSKGGRTSVSLTHQRMTDAAQSAPAKAALRACLAAIAS